MHFSTNEDNKNIYPHKSFIMAVKDIISCNSKLIVKHIRAYLLQYTNK